MQFIVRLKMNDRVGERASTGLRPERVPRVEDEATCWSGTDRAWTLRDARRNRCRRSRARVLIRPRAPFVGIDGTAAST